MYLEQTQLSQATSTHPDILFFRIPRTHLCKVHLSLQATTRHSFLKPANYRNSRVSDGPRSLGPHLKPTESDPSQEASETCTSASPPGECYRQAGEQPGESFPVSKML